MRLKPPTCLLLALVLTGCSGGDDPDPVPSPTIAGVEVYPGLSHEHVDHAHTYAQRPPAGGPHWKPKTGDVYGWQRCGVYTEPVVDEFAVHSLEHGAVWLTYRPGVPAAAVQALTTLASIRPTYVLVSPYPGQSAPVMATAWGLQLSVETAQDPRLAEFTRSYAGGPQGGEPGADCANGATLEQAKATLEDSR